MQGRNKNPTQLLSVDYLFEYCCYPSNKVDVQHIAQITICLNIVAIRAAQLSFVSIQDYLFEYCCVVIRGGPRVLKL